MTDVKALSRRGVLVTAGIATAALAKPPSFAADAHDRYQDLDTALESLRVAMEKGDGPVLDRLLHPDLIYMHSSGFSQSKTDLIRSLAGKQFFAAFTASDIRVQQTGDTALASMTVDQVKNLPGGATRASRIRVLCTWVRRQGHWQMYGRCSALMSPAQTAACAPARNL